MQKTVLITGASSGFGKAACKEFLQGGWNVLAAVRGGSERAPLFGDLIAAYPKRIELLDLDLLDPSSIDRLVLTITSRPPLDALINNAGYGLFGSTEDLSDDDLRKQMEVNFFGTFSLTQKLLATLRQSRGVLLTVSSILGRHALPLTGAYCASKFAVEGWMESLSAELKPFQVASYLLEPGGYPTGFGSSIQWAVTHESSAYFKVSQGYQGLRKKISTRNQGKSVEPVARAMYRLVTKRPLALRHVVGVDALMTALLAKLLPANLWHRLMGATLNRLQRRNAP